MQESCPSRTYLHRGSGGHGALAQQPTDAEGRQELLIIFRGSALVLADEFLRHLQPINGELMLISRLLLLCDVSSSSIEVHKWNVSGVERACEAACADDVSVVLA